MKTFLIVLAVLFALWILKKIGTVVFDASMEALVLRTRTCTLGCGKVGVASYLLCNLDKPDEAGLPVCEACLHKRKGPPIEWLLEKGYLKPMPPEEP